MDSNSTQTSAPARNRAVQLCIEAGRKAYEAARAENQSESKAGSAASDAYIAAIPHLSGADNIRDFIACVAYGMLKQIIFMPTATKLLYAAQVAISGVERNQSPPKMAPASDPSGRSRPENSAAVSRPPAAA